MIISSAFASLCLVGEQACARTDDKQYIYGAPQSYEHSSALGASNAAGTRQGRREAWARIARLRDGGDEPRSAARTELVLEDERPVETGSCCAQTDPFASRYPGPVDDARPSRSQGGGEGKAQGDTAAYARAAATASRTTLADVIYRARVGRRLCNWLGLA